MSQQASKQQQVTALPDNDNDLPSPVPQGEQPRDVRGISAISAAFLENNTLLKKFLTRFLYQRQDIEDVVQETYLRAYKAEKEAASAIEQPRAFLFRVARNIALNELKRKSRHITDSLEECDTQSAKQRPPTLEDELQAQKHLGLYCEAIATLPKQCRRVCLLRKVHGLKHKDIAERLQLSVSSVEKHLRKGALVCEAYITEREGGGMDVPDNIVPHPATHQEVN